MVTRKNAVKDSDILKEVRRSLVNRHFYFICFAIEFANIGTVRQRTSLRRWVRQALGSCDTYSKWLEKHHPNVYADMGAMNDSAIVEYEHAGRLAWLDWMIAECEKAEATNG